MLCKGVALSSLKSPNENVTTNTVAVRSTGEWICVTGNLTRQRKECDLDYNPPLRYDPFAFGGINVKHELPHITSVHFHVQVVKSYSLERNPARFSQIQRGVVNRTPFRLSCDQYTTVYQKKRGRTNLGTERVITNV
jgi:hypothetical protein